MKSNTSVIYTVALLGIVFLGYILWSIDYEDESSYSGPECAGPGIPIDYIVSSHRQELSPVEEEGKFLFKANCAACHKLYRPMTGPALYQISNVVENDTVFNEYITGKTRPYFEKKTDKFCLTFPDLSIAQTTAILKYTDVD
ncbi:c-type cytochrome [Dokdonia sp. LLG6352-1]|uniref:c-type cytochrome n=1 Tax=Dokdonia sp. LLG6352-1 TaxID=3160831 RepID=UPI00386FFA3E